MKSEHLASHTHEGFMYSTAEKSGPRLMPVVNEKPAIFSKNTCMNETLWIYPSGAPHASRTSQEAAAGKKAFL